MEEAARAAASLLAEYTQDISMDAIGNVVGIRRCGKVGAPLLLLEAHQDEIGFLVTRVDEDGFVHVSACGGVDARALAAAEVIIWADKPVIGVFCSTPPHLAGGQGDKLPEIPDMGIDTGFIPERGSPSGRISGRWRAIASPPRRWTTGRAAPPFSIAWSCCGMCR